MTLPMLEKDKANHVVYGFAIYIAAAVVLRVLGRPHHLLPLAFAAVLIVGYEVSKYLAGKRQAANGEPVTTTWDPMDAAAGAAGAAAAYAGALAA